VTRGAVEPEPIDALVNAIRTGRATAKRVLAGLDARSAEQGARLVAAAAHGDHGTYSRAYPKLVRALLVGGVDPDATTRRLPYGIDRGKPLLVSTAHRLYARDRARSAAIEAAALELVRGGAAVDAVDRWNKTALHYAARFGATRLANALIARGAKLDARDGDGETPLFEAARGDQAAVARVLVAAGARATKNRHGETPLDIAIAYGAASVARILARRFGGATAIATPLLSAAETARLLARHARRRGALVLRRATADPAATRVLRGGTLRGRDVVLAIDPRAVLAPPTIRGQLLEAIGEEAERWLRARGVHVRYLHVGTLRPSYTLAGRMDATRADELLRELRAVHAKQTRR
jgi:hypothetical protein